MRRKLKNSVNRKWSPQRAGGRQTAAGKEEMHLPRLGALTAVSSNIDAGTRSLGRTDGVGADGLEIVTVITITCWWFGLLCP